MDETWNEIPQFTHQVSLYLSIEWNAFETFMRDDYGRASYWKNTVNGARYYFGLFNFEVVYCPGVAANEYKITWTAPETFKAGTELIAILRRKFEAKKTTIQLAKEMGIRVEMLERWQEIIKLRETGMTLESIAEAVYRSEKTIYRDFKRMEEKGFYRCSF